MNILAIETSCDETAVAVVRDGTQELCSVVASSKDFHQRTGGIVPEVASRKQVEFMLPVLEQCFSKYSLGVDSISALAVTTGPGLIGSLLVGVEASKALALAWGKPLIPVNHLVGHIYANWLGGSDVPEFPLVALIVSGGHTDLVLMRGHGNIEFLGGTLDDASGEAFDKTARLLGIADYLGGYPLSQLASTCKNNVVLGRLPRPLITKDTFDFSFSGLKTAVRRLVELENPPVDAVACEFETAVVDVLVKKTIRASKKYQVKTILMGGGVSANIQLRTRMELASREIGATLFVPPLNLCTDTASYIGSAGYFNQENMVSVDNLEKIQANPSLGVTDLP